MKNILSIKNNINLRCAHLRIIQCAQRKLMLFLIDKIFFIDNPYK